MTAIADLVAQYLPGSLLCSTLEAQMPKPCGELRRVGSRRIPRLGSQKR